MIQRGNRLRFAVEAFAEPLSGNFDGDIAAQARVMCPIHLAHASRADLRKDFVGTELLTRSQRHMTDPAKFT